METKNAGRGRTAAKINDIKNKLSGEDKTTFERMIDADKQRDPSAYKDTQTPDWMKDEPITVKDKVSAISTLENRGYTMHESEDGKTLEIHPPRGSEASRGTLTHDEYEALDVLLETRNKDEAPGLRNSGKGFRNFKAPMNDSLREAVDTHQSTHTGQGEGGGPGECCIFNQYGGGGCGPCSRGAGPELHTHDGNFDHIFGTEKYGEMPIQPYVDPNGRVFFRFYAIGPGINRHDWAVNSDYIAPNMPSLIDSDITFMRAIDKDGKPYYPHPAIPGADAMTNQLFQRNYKIGKAIDYEKKPDDIGNWYGIGEALEPRVKEYMRELYEKGMEAKTKSAAIPIFVSPQVLHYKDQDPHDIKKFYFQHITFTDDPAFPPAFAKVTGTCVGEKDKCLAELKHASMSRLELMPCFAMAMEEIISKNNTSLIPKQATNSLENSMAEEQKDTPITPQGNENNDASKQPIQPQFQQPQTVEANKINEHVSKLVADMIKDQALSPREKELLAALESTEKANKEKDAKINDLVTKVNNVEVNEKRRDIELILIQFEDAFKKDGKLDEKAFGDEVEFWMKQDKKVEDIKSEIERAMKYAKVLQPTNQSQYASNAGQSEKGQTVGEIFSAPEVGANLKEDAETKQASMSGESVIPFYARREGGRIA